MTCILIIKWAQVDPLKIKCFIYASYSQDEVFNEKQKQDDMNILNNFISIIQIFFNLLHNKCYYSDSENLKLIYFASLIEIFFHTLTNFSNFIDIL